MKKNVKIGPLDPEIIVLKFKKNKEINASKIYSPVGKFAESAKKDVYLFIWDLACSISIPDVVRSD